VHLDLPYAHEALQVPPLPHMSPALTRCAEDIVEFAATALAREDACLLAVALTPRERKGKWALALFDRAMTPHPIRPTQDIQGQVPFPRTAAAGLFEELRPRWPTYASPIRLGVVSDGVGLGFFPQDPWPLAPRWLSRQIDRQSCPKEIIPFGAQSVWSLLREPLSSLRQ
jgi:hypothetical protein